MVVRWNNAQNGKSRVVNQEIMPKTKRKEGNGG